MSKCKKCEKSINETEVNWIPCVGCSTLFHFACAKVPKKRWPDFRGQTSNHVTGDYIWVEYYACESCKRRYHASGDFNATRSIDIETYRLKWPQIINRQASTSKSSKEKLKPEPVITSNTSTNDDISKLKAQVSNLTAKLEEAFQQIAALQKAIASSATNPQQEQISNLTSQMEEASLQIAALQKTVDSTSPSSQPTPSSTVDEFIFYTINGIPESRQEILTELVETVVALKAPNFKFDESTTVKRLPSKSPKHHSILIRTKKGTTQHQALSRARGKVPNGILKQNCKHVFVNESHSSLSYKLYIRARELKKKGFNFVWIREDRVFARKAESDSKLRIFDQNHLNRLLGST